MRVPGSGDGIRILGIDPGSRQTGYGLILRQGARTTCVESGVIAPSPQQPLSARLHQVHSGIQEQIERLAPDLVAVEDLFHAVNARSSLILAQVRGAVLVAVAASGLEVVSYSPAAIKKAVVGNGQAEKSQVAWMVTRLLGLPRQEKLAADAADALAVALCHAARGSLARRLDEAR